MPPANVGPAISIDETVLLDLQRAGISENGSVLHGIIVHVDHFGNLTSNISADILHVFAQGKKDMRMRIFLNDKSFSGPHPSYDSVPAGSPVAVIGSRTYLEIACNLANAADYFGAGPGDEVRILIV